MARAKSEPLADAGVRTQLAALATLAAAGGPVGASTLMAALRAEGMELAEATAGRYLRQLDEAGLTRSLGKRGRVLTPAGRRRLNDLRLRSKLAAQGARVAAAARSRDVDDLIDLLYARRAIEVETARLAALRASDDEIGAIRVAATTHVGCIEGHDRVERAHDFHVLVAKAAHNRMLDAMAEVFLEPENHLLARLLDRIADRAGTVLDMALDHEHLAAALEARDAEEAARLMREHLDKLIHVAEAHRDATAAERPPRPRRRQAEAS